MNEEKIKNNTRIIQNKENPTSIKIEYKQNNENNQNNQNDFCAVERNINPENNLTNTNPNTTPNHNTNKENSPNSIELNNNEKTTNLTNQQNIDNAQNNNNKSKYDFGERILIDPTKRIPTGINGLDELIEGGFEKNSIILIVGSAGTGKTLFGLQFLYEGATQFNDNGVFISFEEAREPLYKRAKQFGWDFEKLEKQEKFKTLFFKPHQVVKIIEEGGGQIRDALQELNAKRVVIDSITAYGLLFRDEYTRREKILEFFNLLGKWGITSIIIAEDSPTNVENKEGSVAFISDAVISMYYLHDEEKGIRIHSLEILKMRGTKHTNKQCAINFEEDGLHIYSDVELF